MCINLPSVDLAIEKDLNNLVREALLKKLASRVNLQTGTYKVANHEAKKEALSRFAKLLS